MTNKDFTPMPTAAANDGFHSWEGTKWESHPYLVVATGGGSGGGGEGAVGWMASAVSHAMTIRVMFTELDDDDETINDAWRRMGLVLHQPPPAAAAAASRRTGAAAEAVAEVLAVECSPLAPCCSTRDGAPTS